MRKAGWIAAAVALGLCLGGCRRGNPKLRLTEAELKTFLELWPGYHQRLYGPTPNPVEARKYVASKGVEEHELLRIVEKLNLAIGVVVAREAVEKAKTDEERRTARGALALTRIVGVPEQSVTLVRKYRDEIGATFKAAGGKSPFDSPETR